MSAILALILLFRSSLSIYAQFGSTCGCVGAIFSPLCPPGLECFPALKESGCRIRCSKGDLRYLYEFNWLTGPFLHCDGGVFRRANGTAVPAVTQLTCTNSPPCNKCPPVEFNTYCEDEYSCQNSLRTKTAEGGCTKVSCDHGVLMVKRGTSFRTADFLTCSSSGEWYSADGLAVESLSVTCTRKKDCQSCPRPSETDRCKDDEIVCIKELMSVSGGEESSDCRRISCKDSHVTVFMGDKIVTDTSITCNAGGNWVLDTPKTEISQHVSTITCSVPLCETCVELKLAADGKCPPDGKCDTADVLRTGGPTDNLCNQLTCSKGMLAVLDGALWVEATSLTCDRKRTWITERRIRVSNTAAATCASYTCDTCSDVLADPGNRCPADATYCNGAYLRSGLTDRHGCQQSVCQMGQLVVWSGREFKSTEVLSCRAGKWRMQSGEGVGADVVATCAFLPCQACSPVQSIINHTDGSVEVIAMPTIVNPSNCSVVDCKTGEIAMYEDNKWRDVKSLTCNYDKQWYVVESNLEHEPFPEGVAVTDYFLAKCAPAKSCQNCIDLVPTAECTNGFCDATKLIRNQDAIGCRRTTCPGNALMIQNDDETTWTSAAAIKCKASKWVTESGLTVSKAAKVTCKADHAHPPCQNCTYSMVRGNAVQVVDACLIVHCRPKGKNLKVFNRYWGAFLSVWFIRCTPFGWMSQSAILINDEDPFQIKAICDEGDPTAGYFPVGIPFQNFQ